MLLKPSRSLPSLLDPERVLEVGNQVGFIQVNSGVRAEGVTTRVLNLENYASLKKGPFVVRGMLPPLM